MKFQALAAAPPLLPFLQLAVSAAEVRADSGSPSQLIAALTDCLKDLSPVTGKCGSVSAWPVLDALRERQPPGTPQLFQHGAEHDACEAVEALMDAVAEDLHAWFRIFLLAPLLTPSLRDLPAIWQHPQCLGTQTAELPSAARALREWQRLTAEPFAGLLCDEGMCLRCHSHSVRQLTPFVMLSLPIAPTLEQSLQSFSAPAYVHDVECTRCSLRASIRDCLSAQLKQSAGRPADFDSPGTACDSANGSPKSSSEPAGEGPSAAISRLQLLCDSKCTLPELDFAAETAAMGLQWAPCRVSLLKRCSVAKPPKVLLLQLRRVQWLPSGHQAKDFRHVMFPEHLPVTALTEAAPSLPTGSGTNLTSPAPSRAAVAFQMHAVRALHTSSPARQPLLVGTCAQNIPAPACNEPRTSTGGALPPARPPMYRLCTVVVHHGGASSGHYSTCRAVRGTGAACHWFRVSDRSVTCCSKDDVLKAEATMLIYELI
eukprot:CAMPEP_0206136750 /NCGR_PEP_ID=MMETSP1473-20131121/1975_1 /ASSEMBLY_ACC=CAM_ASM_001109 /TAXON_ID=1461547 /ORGANISM="Stichococcus sp, Strain RCC1054" /LENGTH=485 /DNA_ID=CAMNT_0053529491 /DNA_START=24 /DNA_END=1482 /DNA_ORIENTATION=+